MYRLFTRSSFALKKSFSLVNQTRMSSLSSRYFADENSPFSLLEAKPFFDSLTLKEKKYAHYMSRASFEGTRIIIAQTNPGAIAIYDLILNTFSTQDGMRDSQAIFEARYYYYCFLCTIPYT